MRRTMAAIVIAGWMACESAWGQGQWCTSLGPVLRASVGAGPLRPVWDHEGGARMALTQALEIRMDTGSGWTTAPLMRPGPPFFEKAAMVFDPIERALVIFAREPVGGGPSVGTVRVWTGSVWLRLPPGDGPVGAVAAAHDSAGRRLLVLGSVGAGEFPPLGLFEYRDRSTRLLMEYPSTAGAPVHMVWDEDRGRAVVIRVGPHGQRFAVVEWSAQLGWLQRAGPAGASAVTLAAGYDPSRRRTIVVVGADTGGPIAETWSWDGTGRVWALVEPAGAFEGGAVSSVSFDPSARRLMMEADGVWALGAGGWERAGPAPAPIPPSESRLVYDADVRRVMAVAPRSSPGAGVWSWDGRSWTRLSESSPLEGSGTASWTSDVTYDGRARAVLVIAPANGVLVGYRFVNGAWEATAPGPPVGNGVAAAFDESSGRVLVVVSGASFETWELDGSAWTRRDAAAPSGTWVPTMAFDRASGRVWMLAAEPSTRANSSAGFSWTGAAWAIATGVPWIGGRLAPDSVTGRLAYFGGYRPNSPNGPVVFHGGMLRLDPRAEWRFAQFCGDSQARAGAFDEARGVLVFADPYGVRGTVEVSTPRACVVDLNADRTHDFNDLLVYLGGFHEGLPWADLNADGVWDFQDLLGFLNLFNGPC